MKTAETDSLCLFYDRVSGELAVEPRFVDALISPVIVMVFLAIKALQEIVYD